MGVNKYCVDSDIIIDYLRGINAARKFFSDSYHAIHISTTVVNIAEVYSGKETKQSRKRERLQEFLKNFDILELNTQTAIHAGDFQRDHQIPFADALIAAIAIFHNATIITRNIKHFRSIPNIKLLQPY